MDSVIYQKPGKIVQLHKEKKLKQGNIQDVCDKKKREETCQYIAQLFYQLGMPFNVARTDSFKHAIEVIGQYGQNMKPPSYHE